MTTFDKLEKGQKLALLLAGLRQYDSGFSNAAWIISNTETNFPDVGQPTQELRQISYKVMQPQYRVDISNKVPDESGGNFNEVVRISWDGQMSMAWGKLEANTRASGKVQLRESIDDPLANNLWFFTQHLGTRCQSPSTLDVASWIDIAITQRKLGYDISSNSNKEGSDILLIVKSPNGDLYQYEVDPARGFAITRDTLLLADKKKGSVYKFRETITDEFRQVDGIYVPWQVSRSMYNSSGKKESTELYEVSEVHLNKVVVTEIPINFDPNTLVVDEVKQTSYELRKDGSRVDRPYLNLKTGKVHPPATSPSTSPAPTPG